jgi:hypothetical protein
MCPINFGAEDRCNEGHSDTWIATHGSRKSATRRSHSASVERYSVTLNDEEKNIKVRESKNEKNNNTKKKNKELEKKANIEH